jgi:hypothetical protein
MVVPNQPALSETEREPGRRIATVGGVVMFEDFAIAVLAAATAATAWLLPALPARADVTTNHSPSIDCPLDK